MKMMTRRQALQSDYDLKDMSKVIGSGTPEEIYLQKGLVFKHPSAVFIVGPRGSGKTNTMTNLILDHFH
jgi:ABC-type lipoprotein export system ATPase subunit